MTEALRRVHILPLAEADGEPSLGGESRLEFLAPELRKLRSSKAKLEGGGMITCRNVQFIIVKCEPVEGHIGTETEFFLDGNAIVKFEKIQFSGWGPTGTELSTQEFFRDVIAVYMKGERKAYGAKDCTLVHIFHIGDVRRIEDKFIKVELTEPTGLGVVTCQTEIFTEWDKSEELEKIHISAFEDTVPQAYEFTTFDDYVRPYLLNHPYTKFEADYRFSYQGVRFKVVATDPPVPGRVGQNTTIYCEGLLPSSQTDWVDALEDDLPPGMRQLLINAQRVHDREEASRRRGLFESTITDIEKFEWAPPEADNEDTTQTQCIICLSEFVAGNDCRRLPCDHVFHAACVDMWLRHCTDCPLCKLNIDRAIRQY